MTTVPPVSEPISSDPPQPLAGRVALVTGGTSGIGRAVALDLARRGADVIVVGRDEARGLAVEQDAERAGGHAEFVRADLGIQAEVRAVAQHVLASRERLDLLVHSAGGHFLTQALTADGIEVNFAVNYLSKYLLTELLQERLEQSASARVVVVGSPVAAPRRFLGLKHVQSPQHAPPLVALLASGMATAVWTAALARKFDGSGVTINNASPGLVDTDISRGWPLPLRLLDRLQQRLFGLSAQEGATAYTWLATASELSGVNGQFFAKTKAIRVSAQTFDASLGRRLLALSARLTHQNTSPDLLGRGRLALVTGGSRGLGYGAARKLALLGYRVVVTSRTLERATDAARTLESEVPGAEVEGLALDLSDFASVRALAATFDGRKEALHLLILNAAQMPGRARTVNAQGLESTFAANHLGHFLLTQALLPLLKRAAQDSGEARVLVISSRLHRPGSMGPKARFDFADPNLTRRYVPMVAYKNSKLANIWFAYELNRRLLGTGVTSNVLCPNFVPETVAEDASGPARFFYRSLAPLLPFARTLDEATDSYLYVATEPALRGIGGKFYGESREISSSPESHDREKAARLWTLSETLTGLPQIKHGSRPLYESLESR